MSGRVVVKLFFYMMGINIIITIRVENLINSLAGDVEADSITKCSGSYLAFEGSSEEGQAVEHLFMANLSMQLDSPSASAPQSKEALE